MDANCSMADEDPDQRLADLRHLAMKAAEKGDVDFLSAKLDACEDHILDAVLHRKVYNGSVLRRAVVHNQMHFVERLVQKFGVDINVMCTSLFPCQPPSNALFYAIKEKNEELVRKLVELGADVNIVKNDMTPLIAACKNQSDHMVRLLIELGADVNLPHGSLFSPLRLICTYTGPVGLSILDTMLKNRADCNWQGVYGSTPLHVAVAHENPAAVQMLLENKARIIQDNFGFTPTFIAAEWSVDGTFEMFQTSDALSREEKIKALEFKAASLAPNNMNGVYDLLHQALEARYEEGPDILPKSIRAPVAAFGYVTESENTNELETKKDNDYALLMECLAVQDRLLGGGFGKLCMTSNFKRIWETVFDDEQYEQAMALAELGIGPRPCDDAVKIFKKLLGLPSTYVHDPRKRMLSAVERGLQWCITLLRIPTSETNIRVYSDIYLKLLNLCIELDLSGTMQIAIRHAKNFLDSFPLQCHRFSTALHAATYFLTMGDVDSDLFMSVVDLLVKCGAEIDKKDVMRRTILGYVLSNMRAWQDRREIVDFLLKQGADPAYVRNRDKPPNDYIKDRDVVDLMRQYYPLPLIHLAAFATVDNRVQYEQLDSKMLVEFIKGHE